MGGNTENQSSAHFTAAFDLTNEISFVIQKRTFLRIANLLRRRVKRLQLELFFVMN